MDALEMASKVIQTGPFLVLGFATIHKAVIGFQKEFFWAITGMLALHVPIQVVGCAESFRAGTTFFVTQERFRMTQLVLPNILRTHD